MLNYRSRRKKELFTTFLNLFPFVPLLRLVKAASSRIIQEQLNRKADIPTQPMVCECEGLQETVAFLKQQLSDALESQKVRSKASYSQQFAEIIGLQVDKEVAAPKEISSDLLIKTQVTEIEELKHKVLVLTESKYQLELRNHKLAEESSYAKGLASAAAVELKELSEEVAKLMNHNERLMAELAAAKNPPTQRRTSTLRNGRRESLTKRRDQVGSSSYLKRELAMSKERELSYEAAFLEKDQCEAELQRKPPVVSFRLGLNPWLLDDPSRLNKLMNRLCNPSKTYKVAAFAYAEKFAS
ncbi:hypothetical protein CXB51_023517 [Gossypium anomalum]|uniref:Uncharacterized protein n=1 Tax=Gossypium anomalum TaxID=47600 RepID=A0A8J6CQL2_9ROSI|nr:hypothetical protein CXB51_023517 [Gossypium anomalum]